MNFIFDQIKEEFSRANSILIATHQKPDGDAIGSSLAMAYFLRSSGKKPIIYLNGPVPNYFDNLPGMEMTTSDRNILRRNFDVAVFLDCSDLSHAGIYNEELNVKTIINIDHHFTNSKYGKINYVDAKASSASEVVHKFFKEIGFEADKKISSCLLTGILSDTGTFTNGATSNYSIKAASSLVRSGANVSILFNYYFKNKSISALRLWGEMLARLKVNRKYSLAYTYVLASDLERFSVSADEIDGITNFMNVIVDAKACLVLKVCDEISKASFRTNKENIDTSKLSKFFGGGGHKKASGFSVKWPIAFDNGKLIIS